jgi:hypothetical protein
MTYAEAKRKAASIDRAVTSRTMPPWPPKAGCGEFHFGRAQLSDHQRIEVMAGHGDRECVSAYAFAGKADEARSSRLS